MIFVGFLMIITLFKSFNTPLLFLVALALYISRIVFKVLALYFIEHVSISGLKDVSLQIMMGTKTDINFQTRIIFQLGGLLQWIVLGIILLIH